MQGGGWEQCGAGECLEEAGQECRGVLLGRRGSDAREEGWGPDPGLSTDLLRDAGGRGGQVWSRVATGDRRARESQEGDVGSWEGEPLKRTNFS